MRQDRAGNRSTPLTVRPLLASMRYWFLVDSFLVLVAGIQLFLLTEQTERFFAWTIADPLTAAFLGACYWASLPLVFLASRQSSWAHTRIAVFGVLAFTTLTLIATLLHLDRFHLADPDPVTRLAAWAWMAIYLLVPPALVVLVSLQLRVPGSEPMRAAPLPAWIRLTLSIHAVVMLALGLLLFTLPTLQLWAWPLTPLTSRAVGAWLIGIGIIAAHAALENDWGRLSGMVVAYLLLAVLQLLALVRYPGSVAWGQPQVAIYVVFLLSILAVGVYGVLATRQPLVRQAQS